MQGKAAGIAMPSAIPGVAPPPVAAAGAQPSAGVAVAATAVGVQPPPPTAAQQQQLLQQQAQPQAAGGAAAVATSAGLSPQLRRPVALMMQVSPTATPVSARPLLSIRKIFRTPKEHWTAFSQYSPNPVSQVVRPGPSQEMVSQPGVASVRAVAATATPTVVSVANLTPAQAQAAAQRFSAAQTTATASTSSPKAVTASMVAAAAAAGKTLTPQQLQQLQQRQQQALKRREQQIKVL